RLRPPTAQLQSAALIIIQLAGPPLGALLFGVAVALPFAVDSASFLLSASLLLLIRRRQAPGVQRPAVGGPSRRQIAQGLSWLWNDHQLRVLAVFTGLV